MINVKIIADSHVTEGKRVTTFELEYPRYIHSELMTHRVFSRNAASSRAIPIEKMIEQVEENTVMPIWTLNQAGMQGKYVSKGSQLDQLNSTWLAAAEDAINYARALNKLGAHKQNVNRILEPYQHIKTIVTSTEFENWFKLRCHKDAQPEIQQLAKSMLSEYVINETEELSSTKYGWHLPYVNQEDDLSLEEAIMVSASCCAQVSYRKNDDSLEKAKSIYDRLINSKPIHASPFEHQCRPLKTGETQRGNLIGYRQLRQDVEDGLIYV